MPTLGYWRQYTSEQRVVESRTRSEEDMRAYLNAMFCGTTSEGKLGFDARTGLQFDLLKDLRPTSLLDASDMAFYVSEYMRNGLRGPCKISTLMPDE